MDSDFVNPLLITSTQADHMFHGFCLNRAIVTSVRIRLSIGNGGRIELLLIHMSRTTNSQTVIQIVVVSYCDIHEHDPKIIDIEFGSVTVFIFTGIQLLRF